MFGVFILIIIGSSLYTFFVIFCCFGFGLEALIKPVLCPIFSFFGCLYFIIVEHSSNYYIEVFLFD